MSSGSINWIGLVSLIAFSVWGVILMLLYIKEEEKEMERILRGDEEWKRE